MAAHDNYSRAYSEQGGSSLVVKAFSAASDVVQVMRLEDLDGESPTRR